MSHRHPYPPRISRRSRYLLETIADTMIPSEGPQRPGAADTRLVDRLLEWLGHYKGAATVFIIYCHLWNLCPLLTGRLSTLANLPAERRVEVLEKFERSRIYLLRMGFVGLKGIFMASFYNDPQVWPFIGYQEGCLSPLPGKGK